MQATLEEKLKKSEELRSTFRHFLTEVAKAAENSKTGRPIPPKVLADYTKQESAMDAELQKVRLRHLMLKAQLAKIEHRVKQKVHSSLLLPARPLPCCGGILHGRRFTSLALICWGTHCCLMTLHDKTNQALLYKAWHQPVQGHMADHPGASALSKAKSGHVCQTASRGSTEAWVGGA